jgi:hypothetical protein
MQKFGKRKGPLGDKRVNKHINTSQIANVSLILMKKVDDSETQNFTITLSDLNTLSKLLFVIHVTIINTKNEAIKTNKLL